MLLPGLQEHRRMFHLLWYGCAGFIGCAWLIHAKVPRQGVELPILTLPTILASLAGMSIGVGWTWYWRTMQRVGQRIGPDTFRGLSHEDRVTMQRHLCSATVLALVLFEAPTMVGLVGYFTTNAPHIFEWCAGVSFFILLVFRIQEYPEILATLQKLDVSQGK